MYHVGSTTTIGRLQKLLRAVVGTALCLVAAPPIFLVAAATLSTDGAAVVYAAVYFGCGIGSVLLVCATIPIVRRAALFRALPMMLAASSTVQAAYSFGLVVAAVWPETYGYGAVLFLMIYGGTAILSCFLATLIRLYCMPLTPPDDVQHDFLGPR